MWSLSHTEWSIGHTTLRLVMSGALGIRAVEIIRCSLPALNSPTIAGGRPFPRAIRAGTKNALSDRDHFAKAVRTKDIPNPCEVEFAFGKNKGS